MSIFAEDRLGRLIVARIEYRDFLLRFLEAADSHVELSDLVEEGYELLRRMEQ